MSDSGQPLRRQSTRLHRPWDSPGNNTGVGCHFLLQYREVKSESEVTQSCLTLSDPMDYSPPGSSVGDSNFSFQLAYLWITRKIIQVFTLGLPVMRINYISRAGKDPFSFQSQRKAMPQNVQTTAQLHSSHMLAK